MKIAYLILAHNNPIHLNRLIASLSTENSAFFLHIDKKSNIDDFILTKSGDIFITPKRSAVHYADFSLVEATLILLEQATLNSRDFDYFVLLSGSDYPIQPVSYIEEYFNRNAGAEFIETIPISVENTEGALNRILENRIPKNASIFEQYKYWVFQSLGIEQKRKEIFLRFGLTPYWGSAWWALTWYAIKYIRNFVIENQQIINFFKNTRHPFEMVFQIILNNSVFKKNIQNNLTYIDWSDQKQHPSYLTDKHLSFFSSSLKVKSGDKEFLFARKFSDNNQVLVDSLDQTIREKELAHSQNQ